MKSLTTSVCALTVLSSASLVLAGPDKEEHFDIAIGVADGHLITGTIGEDGGGASFIERVFGAEFKGGLTEAEEPGFQTPLEPTLNPGVGLGFDINTELLMWNGDGFDSSSTSMTVGLEGGVLSVDTPGSDTVVSGFVFGVANSSGELHDHMDFSLNNAQSGIFLLELTLWTDDALGAADPIWIVFNNGLEEEDHELAEDWVRDNLVPAPGSMGLLAFAGIAAVRRRR